MLTTDLVRIKYKGDQIIPHYIKEESKSLLQVSESLIELYKGQQEKTRYELKECLGDFLGKTSSTLVYKGLSKLLEDRCEFENPLDIDPCEVRKVTFLLAIEQHRQKNFEREKILEETGKKMGISSEEVDKVLFADLKGNQKLQNFQEISPSFLLRRYNTALAQAILLKAVSLQIFIREEDPRRYRQLFRAIKFYRLLYKIEKLGDSFQITLDGPMNLFRSSQKYGLQMAIFLPALLLCQNWFLEAKILWGRRKQQVRFLLDAKQGLYSHYQDTGMFYPPELQVFQKRFENLNSPWTLEADCDFLTLDSQEICIPDYAFRHQQTNQLIYLEIFGFWRKSALEKRIQLLEKNPKNNLILAVSKKLSVDEETETTHSMIYLFHEVLNPKEILKRLNLLGLD